MNPDAGGLRHQRDEVSDRWLLEVLLLEGWTPSVRHRIAGAFRHNVWTILVFLTVNVVAVGGIAWYAARDAGFFSKGGLVAGGGRKAPIVVKKDGTVTRKR